MRPLVRVDESYIDLLQRERGWSRTRALREIRQSLEAEAQAALTGLVNDMAYDEEGG